MSEAKLDLRQNSQLTVDADFGSSGVVTFGGITNLDAGYTLVLDEGLATEQTYTVGNGLVLGADSIAWTFGPELTVRKTYEGYLVSDSKVIGVYLRVKIKLILHE